MQTAWKPDEISAHVEMMVHSVLASSSERPARDGGSLPVSWPHFSFDEICDMRTLNYAEFAGRVMAPFCDGEISELELTRMAADAYADFDDPAVAPLVSLDGKIHILELFHGPTIAFKDYAMQFLARTLIVH